MFSSEIPLCDVPAETRARYFLPISRAKKRISALGLPVRYTHYPVRTHTLTEDVSLLVLVIHSFSAPFCNEVWVIYIVCDFAVFVSAVYTGVRALSKCIGYLIHLLLCIWKTLLSRAAYN